MFLSNNSSTLFLLLEILNVAKLLCQVNMNSTVWTMIKGFIRFAYIIVASIYVAIYFKTVNYS